MELQFLYSKIKEKEKLLNIYEEYQWFVDNDFPIVLPKFYTEIYQKNKNNKKLFVRELNIELNKIYDKNDYQLKNEKVKNNWQKIEREFLSILNDFDFNIKDKYICYISLYGPEGQFKYPNTINLRINNIKDIKEANQTIAHELIHLLIYNKVKKLKLNYKQTEGIVDLFFIETKLKIIFPQYKLQNIAIHNKKIFQKIKKEYNLKNPVFLKKFETRGKRGAFLIRNDKNEYVLKVVPNSKELIARLEFVSKIKKQGVNFPAIISTKSNRKYFLQSGNILFLSEFIDQKENRASRYFFLELGCIVGEFHKIKIKTSKIPELNIEGKVKKLKETFLKKKIDAKIRKEIINFCNSFPPIFGTTTGLVHGDISYFNVLGRKKLFFVDLDDISRGPIIYDLGQMIAFMFNLIPFDFPKFGMKTKQISKPIFLKNELKSFLKKYFQKIKLSKKDIEILPKMAMLACAENIYLEPEGIFKWNYKRFKKIEEEKDLIKALSLKYII